MFDESKALNNAECCPPQTAVFDLKNQRLVSAIGGRRDDYQSIDRVFGLPVAPPIQWARYLFQQHAIRHFYIADLDAITKPTASCWSATNELIGQLLGWGATVCVDLGAVEPKEFFCQNDFETYRDQQRLSLVLPTEGLGIGAVLKKVEGWSGRREVNLVTIQDARGPAASDLVMKGLSLSLDITGQRERWRWFGTELPFRESEVVQTLRSLIELGLCQVILLNLSDIGSGKSSTQRLLNRLSSQFAALSWSVGGGISSQRDLQQIHDAGGDYALIGTWLWQQLSASKEKSELADYFAGHGDQ